MGEKLYSYSLDALDLKERTREDFKAMANGTYKDNETDDGYYELDELKDGIIAMNDKEYWFFSIAQSKWTKLCELETEQRCFDNPSIIFHDDNIYRIGGRNIESDRCMQHCEFFKLQDRTWTTMGGRLNARRCSASAIFLDNHLLAIGGDDNGDELASMEEYDFDAQEWTLRAQMNEVRNDFGICTISKNELFVVGGHGFLDAGRSNSGITGYLDTMEIYNYDRDDWTTLDTKLPLGKRARCGAYHWKGKGQGKIVIAGGTSPCRQTVECLDLETMKWTEFPDLNKCHWWPQIGTLSGESPDILYVAGLNEKYILDVVEYIDLRDNAKKWHTQNVIQMTGMGKINGLCWA